MLSSRFGKPGQHDAYAFFLIFEMLDAAIYATRIEMSSAEKQQFISQYVKTMQMKITESGDVVLEFKRK